MGKRHVDHEVILDTPTTKKRKTDVHQTTINNQADDSLGTAALEISGDVTYSLTTDVVDGVILTDLCEKKWRCGKPIGKFDGQTESDRWLSSVGTSFDLSLVSISQEKEVLERFFWHQTKSINRLHVKMQNMWLKLSPTRVGRSLLKFIVWSKPERRPVSAKHYYLSKPLDFFLDLIYFNDFKII